MEWQCLARDNHRVDELPVLRRPLSRHEFTGLSLQSCLRTAILGVTNRIVTSFCHLGLVANSGVKSDYVADRSTRRSRNAGSRFASDAGSGSRAVYRLWRTACNPDVGSPRNVYSEP